MQPKSARYLRDILDCCEFNAENLQDRTLDDYIENRLLRQAIERNFEIIGEAAGRLSKTDPETAQGIRDIADIIAFRNVLIHGYDLVSHELVWKVVTEDHPPVLTAELRQLLGEH